MYTYDDLSLSRGHSRKSTGVGWEDAKETVYIRIDEAADVMLSLEDAAMLIEDLQNEINKFTS